MFPHLPGFPQHPENSPQLLPKAYRLADGFQIPSALRVHGNSSWQPSHFRSLFYSQLQRQQRPLASPGPQTSPEITGARGAPTLSSEHHRGWAAAGGTPSARRPRQTLSERSWLRVGAAKGGA